MLLQIQACWAGKDLQSLPLHSLAQHPHPHQQQQRCAAAAVLLASVALQSYIQACTQSINNSSIMSWQQQQQLGNLGRTAAEAEAGDAAAAVRARLQLTACTGVVAETLQGLQDS
jgi:hypothetical protein